jgi:hypothetical protein
MIALLSLQSQFHSINAPPVKQAACQHTRLFARRVSDHIASPKSHYVLNAIHPKLPDRNATFTVRPNARERRSLAAVQTNA